jgi:hypothetical protein
VSPKLTKSAIVKLLSEYRFSDIVDPWQICQGHDLASCLAAGLRKRWGNKNYEANDVLVALRLAYESGWFWQTELGKQLNAFLT